KKRKKSKINEILEELKNPNLNLNSEEIKDLKKKISKPELELNSKELKILEKILEKIDNEDYYNVNMDIENNGEIYYEGLIIKEKNIEKTKKYYLKDYFDDAKKAAKYEMYKIRSGIKNNSYIDIPSPNKKDINNLIIE